MEQQNTSTAEMTFRSDYQREQEARDTAIYNDWNAAIEKDPHASREALTTHLMNKYKLHSRSAIWAARKRAEARLHGGN